jgi:hypothetical protein
MLPRSQEWQRLKAKQLQLLTYFNKAAIASTQEINY